MNRLLKKKRNVKSGKGKNLKNECRKQRFLQRKYTKMNDGRMEVN